jgi:hypothetical protein
MWWKAGLEGGGGGGGGLGTGLVLQWFFDFYDGVFYPGPLRLKMYKNYYRFKFNWGFPIDFRAWRMLDIWRGQSPT